MCQCYLSQATMPMKVASCWRIVHVPVWPDMSGERYVPKNVAADCGLWTLGGTALTQPPALKPP